MANPFSSGHLPPKRSFLAGRPLIQRPTNHTVFILGENNTSYDRVGMVLCDHFHKTCEEALIFIETLSQEGRVAVSSGCQDVVETKLRDIRESRYGSRLGFSFEVSPPLKPRPEPV